MWGAPQDYRHFIRCPARVRGGRALDRPGSIAVFEIVCREYFNF
jgi:hypothetical protein